MGAPLLGKGSLNHPLNESDLMRERLRNNIGEASDEEISRMANNIAHRGDCFCRLSDLRRLRADVKS